MNPRERQLVLEPAKGSAPCYEHLPDRRSAQAFLACANSRPAAFDFGQATKPSLYAKSKTPQVRDTLPKETGSLARAPCRMVPFVGAGARSRDRSPRGDVSRVVCHAMGQLDRVDPSGVSGTTAAVVKAAMLGLSVAGLVGALRGQPPR